MYKLKIHSKYYAYEEQYEWTCPELPEWKWYVDQDDDEYDSCMDLLRASVYSYIVNPPAMKGCEEIKPFLKKESDLVIDFIKIRDD